jgi:hypothetical protein
MLGSGPMVKPHLVLGVLLAVAGCSAAAKINVTPLQNQSASQIDADRKRCSEWAKKTAIETAGYSACMITAGYEAPPGIRSTSQRVRLVRKPTANDPIGVLIEFVECDNDARLEAESGLGMVSKAIRDAVGWTTNADKRRQVFVNCLKPRGYQIGES